MALTLHPIIKTSSPSPREFGPKDAAIESNADRIHEERGLGGEEQQSLGQQLPPANDLVNHCLWAEVYVRKTLTPQPPLPKNSDDV